MGCSPWGRKESDTTEQLPFHFSLSCIGEGNDNPLQCSCLENPRDGGAWWAAVYGVAQSRTRLKRLSLAATFKFLEIKYKNHTNTDTFLVLLFTLASENCVKVFLYNHSVDWFCQVGGKIVDGISRVAENNPLDLKKLSLSAKDDCEVVLLCFAFNIQARKVSLCMLK